MDALSEFAEEYTTAKKVRLLALYVLASGLVVLMAESWLFPAIAEFAESAHCRQVLGFPGPKVLFFGVFFGVPLSAALFVGLTFSRRGYKILRDHQLPPVGEKVFRPTRITRGPRAQIAGYVHLASPLPFLVIAVWGLFQVEQLSSLPARNPNMCTANPAVEGAAETLRFSIPSALRAPAALHLER